MFLLSKREPEFNLPSSDDVKALLENIPDRKTKQAVKKKMEIMMANQKKTDKRMTELSDLCKELDQRHQEQKQIS